MKKYKSLLLHFVALIIALLAGYLLYSSYTNFNLVKDGNKPTGYKEKDEYHKQDKEIVVYKYNLYKIVIVKEKEEITYSLKPVFLKDI